MKDLFEHINDATNIEIKVSSKQSLSGANALYTYILTQHKKVSLYQNSVDIDNKYTFLPWFKKIKITPTPSADLSIDFDMKALELYNFFNKHEIKINQKMATSLYAMFVEESEGFTKDLDGTFFAICSLLIKNGAEYKKVTNYLMKRSSLAQLRLKAEMLLEMKLHNNASLAEFILSDEMLKKSGATLEMAKENIKEALYIECVQSVNMKYNDKIIEKLNKEKDFGKKK